MTMELSELFTKAVEKRASDIHLKPGCYPIFRIDGLLTPCREFPVLDSKDIKNLIKQLIPDRLKDKFISGEEVDFAYNLHDIARFRANAFLGKEELRVVLRVIPQRIPPFDELGLPNILEKLSMEPRGLILVTGTAGSGKSTALAAMIDYMNTNRNDHIITIEDPIEFVHKDKNCIITQREIGIDSSSFSHALRSALRQDPDVILVGEMRDLETISTAIIAAETGHLVMSTLHTVDAAETVNRILSMFPPHQEKQIRLQLASVIKGIISLRLLRKKDGSGRVPTVEIMVGTATVKDSIREKEKTHTLPDVIAQGRSQYGMQTFDQSLLSLLKNGIISYEEALNNATNPGDFALKSQGILSSSEVAVSTEGKEKEEKKEKADVSSFFKK